MRQPVPTIANPNFANPNRIAAAPRIDRSLDEMASEVVSRAAAEAAVTDRDRSLAAIRELAERFLSAKEMVLSLLPTEKIAEFVSIDGIDELPHADLLKLEAACGAMVDQIETRAEELERDRVANMTDVEQLRLEVEKLWSVVRALQTQVNEVRGGAPAKLSGTAGLVNPSRANAPQLPRGPATAEAFGGSRRNDVRRIR